MITGINSRKMGKNKDLVWVKDKYGVVLANRAYGFRRTNKY